MVPVLESTPVSPGVTGSMPVCNPTFCHVVWTHLHRDLVTRKDPDEELAHLAADIGEDLLVVLDAWGECGCCAADIDGDGLVGVQDLLAVLDHWG